MDQRKQDRAWGRTQSMVQKQAKNIIRKKVEDRANGYNI